MPQNIDTKQISGDILPTIYISNISLREGGLSKNISRQKEKRKRQQKNFSGRSLSIDISMNIKEVIKPEQTSSWLFNSDFTKFLKIKIIQSIDMDLTKELSKGNFSALRQRKHKRSYAEKTIQVLKSDLKRTTGQTLESDLKKYSSVATNPNNRIYNIPYETKFVVPRLNPEHLSYFVFVYVDMEGLTRKYGLAFRKTLKKGSYIKGVTRSERVILDREVNTASYIFYVKRSGKIWTGAKYKNAKGQWMAGRRGSNRSLKLMRKEVINLKINDYREVNDLKNRNIRIKTALKKFQKLQEKQLNRDQPPPLFTEAYISKGVVSPKPNGQVDLLFHVDVEQLVRSQSAFGSIIDDMQNPRSKRDIYLLSNIKSIKILRRRVTKSLSVNRVGTPVQSGMFDSSRDIIQTVVYSADNKRNGSLTRKDEDSGGIREVNTISFSQNVRTFTITDKNIADTTDGFYQYGVSIDVEDGTIKFLNKQLRKLSNIRRMMQNYYNDAANPRYLTEEGTFNITLTKKYKRMARRNKTLVPWIKAIAAYLDTVTSLTTLRTDPKKLSRKIYSMINAKTGSATGISAFIEMIDELIRIVEATLGNRKAPEMRSQNISKSQRTGGFKVSVMTIDRWFKDLHDSNILRNVGVNVLGKKGRQSIGVKAIMVKDFFQRIGEENSMYWNDSDLGRASTIIATPADTNRTSNANLDLFNLTRNELSFLSPAEINGGSYTINRLGQGKDAWDSDKFNAMASNLAAVQSGYYNNVAVVGNATDKASKGNTRDSKNNNVRNNTHDNSVSSVLAQLGVTILDSLEEESLATIENAGVSDLPINQVFSPTNKITTVSEAQADTHDEVISRRKQRRVERIYRENVKAVGNIFVNMVAANGQIDKNQKVKKSPTTPILGSGIQSYNLKNVNNMVDTVTTAKGGTTINTMPNQVKSLMFSDTTATPTDFLNAPVDMLKNPETAQMMRANFDTLSRVEVFVGFEQDSSNDNIIDKPKYELLQSKHIEFANSKVLLCRIKKYENKSLNIGQNKGLNLQIYDNCFLMSTSELELLLTKKRQLTTRVISINRAAIATNTALGTSVALGLAEQALDAAKLAEEMAAAKETEEDREEMAAEKEAARQSFAGGGKEGMFDFFYNWLIANTELKSSDVLAFLAIVDLDDKNSMLTWLLSNTPLTFPEVNEFLDLLSTLLFEEIIIEDLDNIDRTALSGLSTENKSFLIDWLHTRGDLTFDEIDEIFSKISNFGNRDSVKRVITTWTSISAADIEDALDIVYGENVPEITPYEQALLDQAAAQTKAITDAATSAAASAAALLELLGEEDEDPIAEAAAEMEAAENTEGDGDEQSSGDTEDEEENEDIPVDDPPAENKGEDFFDDAQDAIDAAAAGGTEDDTWEIVPAEKGGNQQGAVVVPGGDNFNPALEQGGEGI